MSYIMNKVHYILLITICFGAKTITFSESNPANSVELLKGIYKGSGLDKLITTTNCEPKVFELVNKSGTLLDNYIKKKEYISALGEVLIFYSKLVNECNFDSNEINENIKYLYSAVNDPYIFLSGFLDNMLSFHLAAKYVSLRFNLNKKDFLETGIVLGEILSYLMKIEFPQTVSK
jgi:hypothetical protein